MTELATASDAVAAEQAVSVWLGDFNAALEAGDASAVAGLFAATSFWRDLVALTWNITTVEGPDGVRAMLEHTLDSAEPHDFRVSKPPAESDGVTEAWLEFDTKVGRGLGHLRLRDGRAFTLLTTLRELTGHEEPRGHSRPMGAEHGVNAGRQSWLERRRREAAELGYETQPEVLIIGGGQGGIALGARLRALDVPTIVIDRHPRPGDQWRGRYKSLCLHDPVWYDHLPYIKFPDNWPVFSPKDKIADWLEMYARVMELNYWGSTTAQSAAYDQADGEWTVVVERDGESITLHPKQLVLATGMSGKPNMPSFPGQDVFAGEQQHSSQHPGPDAYLIAASVREAAGPRMSELEIHAWLRVARVTGDARAVAEPLTGAFGASAEETLASPIVLAGTSRRSSSDCTNDGPAGATRTTRSSSPSPGRLVDSNSDV